MVSDTGGTTMETMIESQLAKAKNEGVLRTPQHPAEPVAAAEKPPEPVTRADIRRTACRQGFHDADEPSGC
jgi:hypothetical protein